MRRSRAAVALGTAAVALGVGAQPVSAGTKTVQTGASGGHILIGSAAMENIANGLEAWTSFKTQESAPQPLDTICNYQGYLQEVHPDGYVVFDEFSGRNTGCSWYLAFVHWPGWTANYLENTGFKFKWNSDGTTCGDGCFQTIGTLRD